VAQLLDIFGFLSVLLRGLTLAFEALTIGGVIFLLGISRNGRADASARNLTCGVIVASLALAVVQICYVAASAGILIGSTDLNWTDIADAGFSIAGALIATGALMIAIFARSSARRAVWPAASAMIVAGSVMTSHSVARIDHRWLLGVLTVAHHVGAAAWIGAMPYLLIALRHASPSDAASLTSRFSRTAMAAVAVLAGAGAGLSYLYVATPAALTGTTYGVMLLSKILLTAVLLGLGALNFKIVRAVRGGFAVDLLPLRRFAETEVGIGFTILLAAASLTSTPPAVDVQADRVSIAEVRARMSPGWPSMETPPFGELSPATPLQSSLNSGAAGSFVPGQVLHPNTPADIAWSEYNHHWAGLVVLAIGLVSILAVRFRLARSWPLLFIGLAVFLLVRADSENWPLGPRGFWESFQVAEVAQHRLFVLLILAFAIFEWCVQTGKLRPTRAGLIFPAVCAVGGALLLTHSHSLGNVKEEFLAELSHIPLAILAVVAGWSRWLELRLPDGKRRGLYAAIWPVCFVLIGAILINYREH
jgi:putative copper resistance protein D